MEIIFDLCIFITISISAVGIYTNAADEDYYHLGTSITQFVCCIIFMIIAFSHDSGKKIDYPEEVVGVSFDKSKPDTLISYQNKDTIFIEFIPKTK